VKSNTLVKLVVAAVVLFLLLTKGVPWIKQHGSFGSGSTVTASKPDDSCVPYGESASSAWSSGVMRFANPPYDLSAWSDFQSSIDSKIRKAEEKCACDGASCVKVREAMSDLRRLVAESDSGIRGNAAPPSDLVQRQEQIDNTIEAARELVRQGK
jgi:hypothetical protein